MAYYKNLRTESPLTAVEFTPVSDGNFAFFHIDSPVKRNAIKQWLASEEVGQEIMAETSINGCPVLVTHGDKSQEEMMKLLESQGDKLTLQHKDKPFNVWALRSATSVLGQSLQMVSALSRVQETSPGKWERKSIDYQFALFSALNMMANVMNFTFGSQKSEDTHQLAHLKDQFNHNLDSHVAGNGELPNVDDNRAKLHLEPQGPQSSGQKVWNFLQRNSVSVGEIGLRFAAAIGLVFPMIEQGGAAGWKNMAKMIGQGEFKEAFTKGINKKSGPLTAGVLYVTGKTLALFTKVPDPYDPKPHTTLDTIREKVLFRTGSTIEMVAGAVVAHNAYQNQTVGYGKNPTPSRDWAGTVGGALFSAGYLVRLFAKFGEKQMNMDELHAHISDSLAKVPPEELPQLIADSAASLKEHFKDKEPNMEFGKVYTQIMTDMYRYHHIALDNLGTEPTERLAKMEQQHKEHQDEVSPELAANALEKLETDSSHAEKHKSRKSVADMASVTPASSHAEKAAQSTGEHLSLGA